MTKSINTLINDIDQLISQKKDWFHGDLATSFSKNLSETLRQHYKREVRGTLRLSQMKDQCPRALWYSVNQPETAQPLRPATVRMFSYGHIIEAQTIALCKAADHEVTGEQDELVVDGIKGHRDCVIDGCIVDVKSTSTPSFQRFKDKSIKENDTFGYLDQLDGYLVGSSDDPLVRTKDRAYILAVDKTLGNMVLYEHGLREASIRSRIEKYKGIAGLRSPPPCECTVEREGESGNVKLGLRASYSPFKYECFPGLRTFIYSKGPVYLTTVIKKPSFKGVPLVEVDRYGNIISG